MPGKRNFAGERRSHYWKADGTQVNGVSTFKMFKNYGRHCKPFPAKINKLQDFSYTVSNFTPDPRRSVPGAWRQTPISTWLVYISRNDHWCKGFILCPFQPELHKLSWVHGSERDTALPWLLTVCYLSCCPTYFVVLWLLTTFLAAPLMDSFVFSLEPNASCRCNRQWCFRYYYSSSLIHM